MDKLFLQVLNMSITSSFVILFVIIARLLLKKTPKVFSYVLWAPVFFRLTIPFSFKSIFSLIPVNTQTVPIDIMYSPTPQIQSGFATIDRVANSSLPTPMPGASMNPLQLWIALGRVVWLCGVVTLIIYSLFTAIKLYRRLRPADLLHDNIFQIQGIKTPFIFGFIKPRIYLPGDLSENETAYIIAHEQTHIKRLDHIIKIFAFLTACIHWFNPMVWVACSLMAGDMELSCDESVIKKLGSAIKKDYSTSLLSLSTGRRIFSGCPLAFGENNTKSRIKNILNYKRPALWISVIAIIVVAAAGAGLLSNPQEKQSVNEEFENPAVNEQMTIKDYANRFVAQEIEFYENADWMEAKIIDNKITKLEKIGTFNDMLTDPVEVWTIEYRLKPDDMNKVIFAGGMNESDGWITEESSMGKPVLVFSYDGTQPDYLGVMWSGMVEISGMGFDTMPGMETTLRVFLEEKGLLPRETFTGDHILVRFPLSTGETCQLLLSQPATQGSHGIWCVERWMDGNGTVYHVVPKTDGRIVDYYRDLQQEVNNGHKPGLMDPLQAALHWINDDLGQYVSADEIRTQVKYFATIEDFLQTPESHYIGFISDFEIDEHAKPYFHLYPIEWLTFEDTERLEELGIGSEDMPNGFYIYKPHDYPMFFQTAEDTEYNIIDWGEGISHKSVTLEEFISSLEKYQDFVPPFRIMTKDGYVREITEQYIP